METPAWQAFLSDDIGGGAAPDPGGGGTSPDPGVAPAAPPTPSPAHCNSCGAMTPNHWCPTCKAHYLGPGRKRKKKKHA